MLDITMNDLLDQLLPSAHKSEDESRRNYDLKPLLTSEVTPMAPTTNP